MFGRFQCQDDLESRFVQQGPTACRSLHELFQTLLLDVQLRPLRIEMSLVRRSVLIANRINCNRSRKMTTRPRTHHSPAGECIHVPSQRRRHRCHKREADSRHMAQTESACWVTRRSPQPRQMIADFTVAAVGSAGGTSWGLMALDRMSCRYWFHFSARGHRRNRSVRGRHRRACS